MSAASPRRRAALGRLLLLAVLWWILSEGSVDALWVGVPAVLVAFQLSLRVSAPGGLRLVALPYFLALFLFRSLVAAADIAGRALKPSMPLRPALQEYHTALPPGLPRVLFANVVSLLPGTLSAEVEGATLQVHVLDERAENHAALRELEAAVARLLPRN